MNYISTRSYFERAELCVPRLEVNVSNESIVLYCHNTNEYIPTTKVTARPSKPHAINLAKQKAEGSSMVFHTLRKFSLTGRE